MSWKVPARSKRLEVMWKSQQGDFLAFPPGTIGAHKFVNSSDAPVTLFILGTTTPHDVSEYPDSNKVLPYVVGKDLP